jgi:pimeloyl-ACP methyl ester carboxylesterase
MLKIPGLTVPHDRVWKLDDYVEWVKDQLKDEEEPIVLLGHSNGGRISIAFAAKYPKKIKKLILIDAAGIYHNELPIRIKRFVFGVLAKVGGSFSDSETLRLMLYKFARVSDYQRADKILRKTMLNLIHTDISNLFTEISAPTTIIWGEKDDTTLLADGKIMNEKIKGSKLFVIKNAKHSPHFTNVEEVGEIILKEYGDI